MATNIVSERSSRHTLPVGSGVSAGDAVVIAAKLNGVALTDSDANDNATVELGFEAIVADLSVVGNDGSAAAITAPAIVYDNSGTLNANTAGTAFGIALEDVGSGETTVIKVLVLPSA